MMHWGYMGSGGLVMLAVWAMRFVFVAAAVVVFVGLLWTDRQGAAQPRDEVEPRSAAEDELELRYVRGRTT